MKKKIYYCSDSSAEQEMDVREMSTPVKSQTGKYTTVELERLKNS